MYRSSTTTYHRGVRRSWSLVRRDGYGRLRLGQERLSHLVNSVLLLHERFGARFLLFFFSSRRRHTRLQGDWSSDVCSSDLATRRSTVCVLKMQFLTLDICAGHSLVHHAPVLLLVALLTNLLPSHTHDLAHGTDRKSVV